jgi:GT2 family glycosyltransferase
MKGFNRQTPHPSVDLVWLGEACPSTWPLGREYAAEPSSRALYELMLRLPKESVAQACLFWDSGLGPPTPDSIIQALMLPGNVWHAGLRLGAGGWPQLLDFVAPTSMLNRDPPADLEATSWRISLRCCLIRLEVLHQMGGVHPEFITLDGAALEMGHRYATRGVLTRHIPWLLPEGVSSRISQIPFDDELRLIYYRFGWRWTKWALLRGVLTHYISPVTAVKAWREISRSPRPPIPGPFVHDYPSATADLGRSRVSVLIPTLDRYPYLRTLLGQLQLQTIKPHEIIIVDQTMRETRDTKLGFDFRNLPLKIIYLDRAGQCSARNAGLAEAQGEFILFLDDDDEVPPDLIEAHIRNLTRFQADVSSGVAEEVGAGDLPEYFTYIRLSDVFPTNNTLIHRRVLDSAGLFDLAYDRGARADADIGMRIYLHGGYMILNPEISVLHHHAPAGGLRAHKARAVTYASSRQSLFQRHLPSTTEIYLANRYFTPGQVRESLWQRVLGTLSLRGPWWRRGLKILIGLLLLPHTWWQIKSLERQSDQMLQLYPRIPTLSGYGSEPSR